MRTGTAVVAFSVLDDDPVDHRDDGDSDPEEFYDNKSYTTSACNN